MMQGIRIAAEEERIAAEEIARQIAAEDGEFIGHYPGKENRDPEYNLDITLPAPSRRVNISDDRGKLDTTPTQENLVIATLLQRLNI